MAELPGDNELSNALKLDQSLVSNNAPVARWQRKALETSCHNSTLNANSSGNKRPATTSSFSEVVIKKLNNESLGRTPKNRKTPSKSPSRLDFTPRGSKPSTPSRSGGDRFIPSRSAIDWDASKFLLQHRSDFMDTNSSTAMSPQKIEHQKKMALNLCGTDMEQCKILSYQKKAPIASDGYSNGLKVLYSHSQSPISKSNTRHIPQAPDRILDAPDIVNDYYLNLVDWSSNNHLAVSLGPHVYLWNAASGEIQQLMELESPEDYVCSVKWIKEGNILAVGNLYGEVSLWDVEQMKKIRTMNGHADRVGSLCWNEYVLSSGSRSGKIHHSDVRIPQHLVSQFDGHTQEVCGLSWSPDGKILASGGNDNILNLWSISGNSRVTETTPLHSFSQHQAAVKALAWCPWQGNILASGGGTADRCIRIWNSSNGTLLNTVDTKSQVCSLLWAPEHKELVSAHGYANNEIAIWKYPSMTKTAELLGHTERVLHLAISPDGSTVVSGGADETLRLWRCFAPDPNKKRIQSKGKKTESSVLKGHIR
jgi:cell division cycle protein 20 (cofactor of APC complex)